VEKDTDLAAEQWQVKSMHDEAQSSQSTGEVLAVAVGGPLGQEKRRSLFLGELSLQIPRLKSSALAKAFYDGPDENGQSVKDGTNFPIPLNYLLTRYESVAAVDVSPVQRAIMPNDAALIIGHTSFTPVVAHYKIKDWFSDGALNGQKAATLFVQGPGFNVPNGALNEQPFKSWVTSADNSKCPKYSKEEIDSFISLYPPRVKQMRAYALGGFFTSRFKVPGAFYRQFGLASIFWNAKGDATSLALGFEISILQKLLKRHQADLHSGSLFGEKLCNLAVSYDTALFGDISSIRVNDDSRDPSAEQARSVAMRIADMNLEKLTIQPEWNLPETTNKDFQSWSKAELDKAISDSLRWQLIIEAWKFRHLDQTEEPEFMVELTSILEDEIALVSEVRGEPWMMQEYDGFTMHGLLRKLAKDFGSLHADTPDFPTKEEHREFLVEVMKINQRKLDGDAAAPEDDYFLALRRGLKHQLEIGNLWVFHDLGFDPLVDDALAFFILQAVS